MRALLFCAGIHVFWYESYGKLSMTSTGDDRKFNTRATRVTPPRVRAIHHEIIPIGTFELANGTILSDEGVYLVL